MLEKKVIILSEKEQEKLHFDAKKGKCFPPSWTRGGLISPYNPSDFERKHCGYAPNGFDCSKHKTGPLGGKSLKACFLA